MIVIALSIRIEAMIVVARQLRAVDDYLPGSERQ